MTRNLFASLVCAAAVLSAGGCDDSDKSSGSEPASDDDSSTGDDLGPAQLAACSLPVAEPTRLVITTTDFATGGVGLVDVATRTLQNDLALGSTDAIPFVHEDRIFVVHRFMLDYLDVLDASNLGLLIQTALTPAATGSINPYSIAFDPRGVGYVPLFGSPEVRVLDLSNPAVVDEVDSIDMSSVADGDGNPELGQSVACGDYLWVTADRLDPTWNPVDNARLVAIDTTTREVLPAADGVTPGSVVLLGQGAKQIRLDPADPSGTTLLVLTGGLERVDLVTGQVSWVIPDTTFVDAGISRLQLSQFDVAADGRLYFSVSGDEWPAFGLWRASATGNGADLSQVVTGLASSTGALEVIGNEAWFLDTTPTGSGVRIFDLAADPVAESTTQPLSTGLPPYALVALP